MAFFRRKNNDPLDPQNLAEHLRLDGQPAMSGFQLTVQTVFEITGRGTVVTGLVDTGSIAKGAQIVCTQPDGGSRTAVVEGIEVAGKNVGSAATGDTAALLLRGIKKGEMSQGDVLAG